MEFQQHRDDLRTSLVGAGLGSSCSSPPLGRGNGDGSSAGSDADMPGLETEYHQSLARRNLAITVTCTTCMLMLYGYDFGITAWTVLTIKLKGADGVTEVYSYLTDNGEVLGLLVACASIGGFIASAAGSKVANQKGRKAEIQLVGVLCIFGACLEGFAGMQTWSNTWFVVAFAIGRFTYGLGLGLSLRCGPMYLRETVTGPLKNAATVSIKLAQVVGIILGYLTGAVLSDPMLGYFGVVFLGGASLACLQVLPESPMFMLLHEDWFPRTQILDSLKFTSPAATESDLLNLQTEILREVLAYTPGHPSFRGGYTDGASGIGFVDEDDNDLDGVGIPVHDRSSSTGSVSSMHEGAANFRYESLADAGKRGTIASSMERLPSVTKAPGMHAALVLTAGLMVFEQASGMPTVLFYGGVFLKDIDIVSVDWGLAILGVLQLVAAVGVKCALDPVGRKPLLDYGLAGLLVSSLMLTIGGALGMADTGRWWALIGLFSFTASYSTSLGALVWVLVADVFPTCHRAQAVSIILGAHFGTCATILVGLPLVDDVGGYTAMFACFFMVAVLANLFAHRFMVETRGLSAVQIQRALTIKSKAGGFVTTAGAIMSRKQSEMTMRMASV